MKQIVLIPCWKRPEFLLACLKLIQRAEGWKDHKYIFSVDRGYDPAIIDIYKGFEGDKKLELRKHTTSGNSYNLIMGYMDCLKIMERENIELCNMIETDIFIAEDYFTFHEAVNEYFGGNFFASACRNQNRKEIKGDDPTQVYESSEYQSLGVSFLRGSLQHIRDKKIASWYYRDPRRYCMQNFPNSRFGDQCTEQDGLIDRIIEADGLHGIYPIVPRAYHAGYYGYNRQGVRIEKSLSLEEQAEYLLAMNEEEMNKKAYISDIAQCALSGREHLQAQQINGISI